MYWGQHICTYVYLTKVIKKISFKIDAFASTGFLIDASEKMSELLRNLWEISPSLYDKDVKYSGNEFKDLAGMIHFSLKTVRTVYGVHVWFLSYNMHICHSLGHTLGCLAWSSCLLQHGSPRCSPDPYHRPQASLEITPPQLNLWSLHCKQLQSNKRKRENRSERKANTHKST